jgi:L-histidine Nalpha-methyltransferase
VTTEHFNTDNLVSVNIRNLLPETGPEKIREEIIGGLLAADKYILSKYFYDKKGSELFRSITELEVYYPTRTEKNILEKNFPRIAEDYPVKCIVELGSGDCSKISLLLRSLSRQKSKKIRYIPIDISKPAIEQAIQCLSDNFDGVEVEGIVADFMTQLHILPLDVSPTLFCFFGSTLGNFGPASRREFLKNIGGIMNKGDTLLLGTDMVKDIAVLENAYNDEAGITAEFNKNILNAVNTILQTDFNIELFEHIAFYNREAHRIEMHLKARTNMEVTSPLLISPVCLEKGEMIHTENSYKFMEDEVAELCHDAGLSLIRIYSDRNKWFSLFHFIR